MAYCKFVSSIIRISCTNNNVYMQQWQSVNLMKTAWIHSILLFNRLILQRIMTCYDIVPDQYTKFTVMMVRITKHMEWHYDSTWNIISFFSMAPTSTCHCCCKPVLTQLQCKTWQICAKNFMEKRLVKKFTPVSATNITLQMNYFSVIAYFTGKINNWWFCNFS